MGAGDDAEQRDCQKFAECKMHKWLDGFSRKWLRRFWCVLFPLKSSQIPERHRKEKLMRQSSAKPAKARNFGPTNCLLPGRSCAGRSRKRGPQDCTAEPLTRTGHLHSVPAIVLLESPQENTQFHSPRRFPAFRPSRQTRHPATIQLDIPFARRTLQAPAAL